VAFLGFRRYARQVLSRPSAPTYPAGFIEPCLPTVSRTVPNGSLWVHDLLELNGEDLRADPWDDRRVALARLLRNCDGRLGLSEGATVFKHACAMGLEGIVAKRRDRPYRSGRRAGWIKVKNPQAPASTRIMEWE